MRKNCLGYPVELVDDVFAEENDVFAKVLAEATGSPTTRILLVSEMNVVHQVENIGTKIGRYVQAHSLNLAGKPVVINGSERVKGDGLASMQRIARAAMEAQLSRNDCIVAMGGGATLDVAGYVAAQIRGGVKIIRIPTTITAMTDAAFADYAAVNWQTVKDAYRVASIPTAVFIDTSFAKTLLDAFWRGGLSSMVAFAIGTDAAFFKKLQKNATALFNRDGEVLRSMVADLVALRQKKPAKPLGQWAALRLEGMIGWRMPHGRALAIGLMIDTYYAQEQGLLSAEDCQQIRQLLIDLGSLEIYPDVRSALVQADVLLRGLDAWRLSTCEEKILVPSAIGKTVEIENPDRETMKRAINLIK